jgi:hypothetical protein
MAIMAEEEAITLKEVQLRLGVPQHVLIHLCEKGVIEPDFADTSGRGKRREFSRRNLFEFGVALALRKFDLPVATAAFVVRLLRSFARATGRLVPGFELPGALLNKALDLELHLFDGELLVFSAQGGQVKQPILLAVSIDPSKHAGARPRVARLDSLPRNYEGHLEIDLNRIACRVMN